MFVPDLNFLLPGSRVKFKYRIFNPNIGDVHPGSRGQKALGPGSGSAHWKKIVTQIPTTKGTGITPFLEESGNKFLNYL
jgi:hypothetical protein